MHKFTVTTEDIEKERLADKFGSVHIGQVVLAACPLRCSVRVVGEVSGLRVVPRAGSPSLEVSVNDGTGDVVAVFTGRRRIKGIDPGRSLVLEGVARRDRRRTVFLNPVYTLLP